ncbi:uncharacterized protein FIBRA_07202 [Fibroporia radiculosa]|uniref:Cytochrome P450 n=1 Tax=Fibroporia radiculosa TaxID=599839 RepID=J4GDS3_9APHY|nr:uncharacterized protein FIBRA_07202 [Fibroporia radiculosa]CCM05003.1 predicted protein [Fibroporia radiculosa]
MAFPARASDWLILSLLVLAFVVFYTRREKRQYPPGPPSKPIIGNIFEVSPREAWLKFIDYKRQYGDILFFHGLGNSVLVLSSMKSIHDLLEKRGRKYSDRPTFTVVGELMGLDQSMALLPYGDEWRAHRKLAHAGLGPVAIKRYHSIQEDLAALLCQRLLSKPEDFFSHVRLYVCPTVYDLHMDYQWRKPIMKYTIHNKMSRLPLNKTSNQYITLAEETMSIITQATVPGAFICDLMPSLKYLPSWVPFQREASKGREMIESLASKPFEHVKREMASGQAPPSLTQTLLSSEVEDVPNFEHRVKWTAGVMYGAGGESTYATVLTFILAMALHPEKQSLAQAELDEVIGAECFPRIQHRDSLPYVNALVKETMRWHPVVPLGIARQSSEEDFYEGYHIPKGTIVMTNVWALALEENEEHDPKSFIPERFLKSAAKTTVDPSTYMFGFAKRVCPGKALAENSVFILISGILSMFNIEKDPQETLKPEFTPGLVSYPTPFKCQIVPRSSAHANVITSRAAQCSGK